MRRILALAAALALPVAAHAQEARPTAADSAGIRRAATDYANAWYLGDSLRMQKALHPQLAKRIVRQAPDGQSRLEEMTAAQLWGAAGKGYGTRTPEANRRADVRILDVYQNAASVRLDMHGWVDYMQLGKWNGEWRIVNVLWATRPQPQSATR